MNETPFNWIADGEDADSQCTKCFCACHEDDIEAITAIDGVLYYCCPDCAEELKRDFEE